MSVRALAWAQRITAHPDGAPLTAAEKLLLVMIAWHHIEEHDYAWPSVSRLAEECVCSQRHVQRLAASLQEGGLIRVEVKGEGRRNQFSNRYYLPLLAHWGGDAGVTTRIPGGPRGPANQGRPAPGSDAGVTMQAQGGDAGVATPVSGGDAGGTMVVTPVSGGGDTGGARHSYRIPTLKTEEEVPASSGNHTEEEDVSRETPASSMSSRRQPYQRPHTPERWLGVDRALLGLGGYAPTAVFYEQLDEYAQKGVHVSREAVKIADWCRHNNALASVRRILSWLDKALEDQRGESEREGGEPASAMMRPSPVPDEPLPITVSPEAQATWSQALGHLQQLVNAGNYETFLRDTEGLAYDGQQFTVSAPNTAIRDALQTRFHGLLRKALGDVMGDPPRDVVVLVRH